MSGLVGFVGDEVMCAVVRPLLPAAQKFECFSVPEAIAAVEAGQLTLLIVAYDTDDWRGAIEQLTRLNAAASTRPLAIFALVPSADPEALAAVLDLGAADAACVPINPHEVRARLSALLKRRKAAQAKQAETLAVLRLSVIDPVTGLHNRHHLDTALPAAIDAARATAKPLALLMLDLDALKPFNDRYGHTAGDQLLRAVARTLQAQIRTGDTAARYGGDEIAVVMPDTDAVMARALAGRLNAAVANLKLGNIGDDRLSVTVSVGVAMLTGADRDAKALLRRADAALYDAKRLGRNRVAEAA